MSQVIKQIEAILNLRLHEAPKRDGDPLAALMPFKENYPKYALDEDGNVIGLNLAKTGLTDTQLNTILFTDGTAEHLRALNLSQNELTFFSFPDGLALRKLEQLNLAENRIREFSLPAGVDRLKDLDLEENPMENPGPEILKQGKAAFLRFLRELITQGVQEVFEVKMLIVGEGGTGKTTLWSLLQNPDHPVPDLTQESTVGIQIKEGWGFQHLDRPADKFLVNLWDFGGQDIQYMTHQFFLTRRSFYVLFADVRREVANFPYWLKIISLLGCDEDAEGPLPVLVVLNEKGSHTVRPPYDAETVRNDFPKLELIRREVDFAKKEDGRFDALKRTIQDILCHKLGHLPLKFPKNYDAVRLELYRRRSNENHIDSSTFNQICESKGVHDPQNRKDLSKWLHDLGVILHFRDDLTLSDFIVLNPQWAANAVYQIMKHKDVLQNQGRFDKRMLQDIWNEAGFTDAEQGKLTNLMLKNSFEVCFGTTEKGRDIYIAPQLLPDQRPDEYEWSIKSAVLRYNYLYPFMPNGIIGRLIVNLHEEIAVHQGRKIVWSKGALLEKEGCLAQITESFAPSDGRKIIKIEVQGASLENRKNVLRDIRLALDKIHSRSFPTLKVSQRVPCICFQCQQAASPNEFDFVKLKEWTQPTIQCLESGTHVSVQELFEGVFPNEHTGMEAKFSSGKPKKVFFSYSKEDAGYLKEFLKHLAPLRNNKKIQSWNDEDLRPGEDWDARIRQELAEADIIILLVSADFLSTPYIQSVEIETAMNRDARNEAVVIPVILRPCDWEDMPFGRLSGLPAKGQPVSTYAPDYDTAWLAVVKEIKKLIEPLTK